MPSVTHLERRRLRARDQERLIAERTARRQLASTSHRALRRIRDQNERARLAQDAYEAKERDRERSARRLVVIQPDAPKTRGECQNGPRPCPYATCRYHLQGLDNRAQRAFLVNPSLPTCALDVADKHPEGVTLETVGEAMGLTRERIRQLEATALRKLKQRTKSNRFKVLHELLEPEDESSLSVEYPLGITKKWEW